MRFLCAIVALCAAGLVILNEYRWRKQDNRHASFRTVVISVLILLGLAVTAQARPSPYPPVTQFAGDRYASAQLGPEVVRAMRCPPPACQRKPRKRAPVSRKRWRDVPMPVSRPGIHAPYRVEAPISLGEGLRRAVGRPAAWCGWWLGQHLGMPLRKLWLARNWAHIGSPASPGPGVIVVWRHHVGIITGKQNGQWIVKSGNDGRAVRERARSVAGAIAFRRLS
jgi:hypothetical protein